jgi:hypothetical protein
MTGISVHLWYKVSGFSFSFEEWLADQLIARKPKKLFVTLIPVIVWAIAGTFGAFWGLVTAY